ncbi:leucine-rich repeat and calponin homology domain-containing protein isoform X2 [Bradysia coprophila]|uniref:leucine-rich repeat and calponin homology domain-containing protein isoform X2 n=1 Tax=Bradysia coprophila TaxID=38358 RepID=UPI00187D8D74|nr:leucine-rich repeat and calponin homology domain-containing protein isoform X2 [Bradysia coprophila]
MAAVVLHKSNTMNIGHQNLSRSLERILEDAALSGELKLSCRKLKDFPKIISKYNLSDTVIADLSRNRFCELPEDVTNFPFLETLLVYHNTLRTIPETVRGLHSLSYLDLRSNQLSVLPREICLLPLQVLLVSNNRLLSLPEELGRMDLLTELDVSCNQITHLPARMSDLKSLKSLSLRSNQLVYLPKEVTCLQLVSLDISCNRIATLPVELRLMTSLVSLELENNPLTSPPASLCVRGLVHVFKFLDNAATKDEKTRAGGNFDGHTTLRRTIQTKHNASVIDGQKGRRQHVDSGYSTSDGLDKRWSQEAPSSNENGAKWSPTPLHIRSENDGSSPIHTVVDDECKRPGAAGVNGCVPKDEQRKTISNGSHSNREYKEALRQQRNQDSTAIYRPKEQQTPTDSTPSSTDSPTSFKSQNSTPSPTIFSSNQSSPTSPHPTQKSSLLDQKNKNGQSNGKTIKSSVTFANPENDNLVNKTANKINKNDESDGSAPTGLKKPVQKVTPSRNTNATYQSPTNWTINGNHKTVEITTTVTKEYNVYVKPSSPTKSVQATMSYNNVPTPTLVSSNGKANGTNKVGPKQNRTVSWNRDIPAEKLSFTMRREFDKQKEETELIEQLRKIIESRLKMSLPKDISSALIDGVVLCHLANHVRPRSVASIHVPSAAVPKLTMARARRNVDNFLNACRSIGVDEELICSCSDIVPDPSVTNNDDQPTDIPNPSALLQTVTALLLPMPNSNGSTQDEHNTATNTKISLENDNYELYFKKCGVHFQKSSLCDADATNNHQPKYSLDDDLEISNNNSLCGMIALNGNDDNNCDNMSVNDGPMPVAHVRRAPNTLDLSSTAKKRKYNQTKRNLNASNSKFEAFQLNGITEECEYDSDVGKFNCRMETVSDNSSGSFDFVDGCSFNTPTPRVLEEKELFHGNRPETVESNVTGLGEKKIVMKRIEFFEGSSGKQVPKEDETLRKVVSCDDDNKTLSTVFCLGGFLVTALILYLFPLPN